MKNLTLFALLALVAVPVAANAGSDVSKLSTMKKPGEWQMTITRTVTVPGTKMSMPSRTITKKDCVTQKDLDDLSKFKTKTVNGMTCNMTKKDLSGNTYTFVMNCSGKPGTMQVNSTTVFDSKNASHSHVVSTGKMHGMPIQATADIKSKRLGECTAPPAATSK